MKRHESLIPLTHDHHHVLARARGLRLASEQSDESRRAEAKKFLEFFRDESIDHFREEEEVFFPLIVDVPEARTTLERVMIEHLQIHASVRRLQVEFSSGIPTPGRLIEVAALLEQHVRFEEKVVFPMLEALASETDLNAARVRVHAVHLSILLDEPNAPTSP